MLGIQSGINVVGAMIYPTSLRANGSGWQLGIGRLGAIVGPLLGALFVGLPVEQLYIWSALPFAAGAVVAFLIYRAQQRAACGASGIGEGAVAIIAGPREARSLNSYPRADLHAVVSIWTCRFAAIRNDESQNGS